MTQNILGYMNYLENVRHNRYTEGYGERSLAETVRHNQNQEALNKYQIDANYRVGMANVGAQYASIAEMNRHNIAGELYNWSMFPVESAYKLAQTESTQANQEWIVAKTDESRANTNLIEVNTVRTVTQGVMDILKAGAGLMLIGG